MKMTKTGRMAILSTIIAVGLAAITAVHVYYIRDVQRENREALQHSTAILADRLNGRIHEMIHTVEGLGAFLTATPSLPNPDAFDHYARQAILTHATLRALQVVDTNGVIAQEFPVQGNESVLGLDLTPLADWHTLKRPGGRRGPSSTPNPARSCKARWAQSSERHCTEKMRFSVGHKASMMSRISCMAPRVN